METVDISWMSKPSHHGASKDSTSSTSRPLATQNNNVVSPPAKEQKANDQAKDPAPTNSKPIVFNRPNFSRTASTEKTSTLNGSTQKALTPPANPGRRNSWLSSISSKFSNTAGQNTATPPASPQVPTTPPPAQDTAPPAQPHHAHHTPHLFGNQKVAILQPGARVAGDEPYIPAPPKATQPSFLQSALRRLSSSGGQLQQPGKGVQHGLCERRVLNVDRNRERCRISELDQSKLRRVAFCVDVEIASGPRYLDEALDEKKGPRAQTQKKSAPNKAEPAKKNPPEKIEPPRNIDSEKKDNDQNGVKKTGEPLKEDPKVALETTVDTKDDGHLGDGTKKKEKKKRSEEERKARKEKKRRQAEANGTLPVELTRNDSDDSSVPPTPGVETPKTQGSPTTDPVRIYRRCCALRETPILKKITEQLASSTSSLQPGVVIKLDLTDYWLQLPDLVTLGDYLAVVPVKELIMENCGLNDEGIRVILAGLLATKSPDFQRRKFMKSKDTEVTQGGFVERLVLKNNQKIGRDGWRYISLFINMCRTVKYLDLSKVPFPQALTPTTPSPGFKDDQLTKTLTKSSGSSSLSEISCLLDKALSERLAGKELELLNLAECGLTTEQIGCVVDGVIKSGMRRLGLAGNNLTPEGMRHVARYIREGTCEGLDVGGNDLKDQLGVLAEALNEDTEMYALCLADCNLDPDSLWTLFPALAKLKQLKFLDLSSNHALFEKQPSALSLLRRYMPKMPMLKRIHLTDVSMSPEQAIALAEILPESPSLAHVNMLENPQLVALAMSKNDANQEEACALYASLMAAVRVSQTIVSVEIEVPSSDSSEVVKALAKQVIAYCLWNMERLPVTETQQASADLHTGPKEVAVPDVLLHLVGHIEGEPENHDEDAPAPDEDYVIGGTGVVKALGICLRNSGNDSRRPSSDRTFSDMSDASGSATPRTHVSGGKAKDMSKNLLGSARKIRARLQPALVKESQGDNRQNYQRLQFLDSTLLGMIKRFEEEFPETRLPGDVTSPPIPEIVPSSPAESFELDAGLESRNSDNENPFNEPILTDDEDAQGVRPVLSRHNSDVSIASRALAQEEGRMHRFGQKLRRDILKPESEDHAHGTTGLEQHPQHIQALRDMLEGIAGEDIKKRLESTGEDEMLDELSKEASLLKQQFIDSDPEGWEKFKESMEQARRNTVRTTAAGPVDNGSAVSD